MSTQKANVVQVRYLTLLVQMTEYSDVPELCPCGEPLHYRRPESQAKVEDLIAKLGSNVEIRLPSGKGWMVPRHYIALHGVRATALPTLASRYGWEAV